MNIIDRIKQKVKGIPVNSLNGIGRRTIILLGKHEVKEVLVEVYKRPSYQNKAGGFPRYMSNMFILDGMIIIPVEVETLIQVEFTPRFMKVEIDV